MNRFEKLLMELNKKIDDVCTVCGDIVENAGALKVFEGLKEVVEILKDPNAAMNRRTSGFVAARAEEMIGTLTQHELNFLFSRGAFETMRERITALHPKVTEKHDDRIRPAFMYYRYVRETRADVNLVRKAYIKLRKEVQAAEANSIIERKIDADGLREVIDAQTRVGVVTRPRRPITVRRPNKVRARARSAEHRQFVEKHNTFRTS